MKFQVPRGTQDILPERSGAWQAIEARARDVSERYGYAEIRTPIFEATELFLRGVGETTDIVTKEMYTFADRKGRSLTLRPEGTAGVMRALVEHGQLLGRDGDVAVHRVADHGPAPRHHPAAPRGASAEPPWRKTRRTGVPRNGNAARSWFSTKRP